MSEYVLEMIDIEKSFPGVKALDHAQLKVRKGTVHALMGENGAGKSTLMKGLFGIYFMDGGKILLDGEQVNFKSSKEALNSGVAMIHQELQPIKMMTIAENIFLGNYPRNKFGLVDHEKMIDESILLLNQVGLDVHPKTLLNELTISQMQSVEIAKAISHKARIVIMDEPTSSLTSSEVEKLFKVIEELKEQGIAIIYISHKMEEILRISDEVTILRDGQYVGTWPSAELTTDQIIRNMVGRELKSLFPPRTSQVSDEVVLEVKNFTSPNPLSFKDCSFELKKGEILAVGGLVGAQRTELLEAVYGIRATVSGEIKQSGEVIKISRPQDAIRHGIALLTEDRRGSGIFGVLSVSDNVAIASVDQYASKAGILDGKKINDVVENSINSLAIKTPNHKTAIQSLSGGNQQKVIIARWLASNPNILILDEPTRGIDVGAKYEIYQIIGDMVEKGKSVIMITSEMSELIGFSDRIMVMCEGRVSGFLDSKEATQEKVMALATKFM